MVISKRVGRMALEALGTAPCDWEDELCKAVELLQPGWMYEEQTSASYFYLPGVQQNTLLCLIASIAGVKP